MTDLADRMCWTLKVREKELGWAGQRRVTVSGAGRGSVREQQSRGGGCENAVWQKPSGSRCYSERGAGTPPPMCESDDNPDAAWYVPMKACLNPVPAFKGMRAAQWPAMGRARLKVVPAWLQMLKRGVFGGPAVAEMKRDQIHWKKVVAFYDASFGIDWTTVRNVMDMNAHYGGFAAELAASKKPLWVLSVVPTSGPDSLPIVFERGLVGIYHDWCESFNSYPRSYDLLHADHTVSQEVGRCDIASVLLEMDRLLRPEGWAVFRDHARMGGTILNLASSFHWRLKFNQTEGGEARSTTRRIRVTAAGIDIEPRASDWGKTMKNCQIILGSSSQSRQQVLREIDVPFEIMKPGIDEEAIRSADPNELVSLLSRAKADALLAKLKAEGRTFPETADVPTLLITADQVVVHEDRILEKPLSEAEAREFIRGYSRAPARTVGAVLVTNLNSGKQAAAVDVAEVHFRPIPDAAVDQLVAEGDIFFCAGGLMVEHPLVAPLVEKMVGSIDAVMGLSKETTISLMQQVTS
ncbi:unnamed protein product [Closterium sp. Yama58-4]|nr:unnamed protein product [Closterium sp. Yama58-4]